MSNANVLKPSYDVDPKELIAGVMKPGESVVILPPGVMNLGSGCGMPPRSKGYVGLFSSGTTGTVKCVWNSGENLRENANRSAGMFEVQAGHKLLIMAAPWHVAGLTWALMAEQTGCAYEFVVTQKGDHERWIRAVQDAEADYLFTGPGVLRALYDADWFIPKVVWGGRAIEFEEYELISPHCEYMYQGYGQTEAGGLIACHKRKSTVLPEHNEHLCAGKPMQGVEVECEGSPQNPDAIFVKSATAATAGFYDTRDLGYVDEHQNLYVTGRKDATIRAK